MAQIMTSTTILVVDDHQLIRLGVSHFLQPASSVFEVVEARSQEEADTILANGNVDLAIVDISLPDGSGLELIRANKSKCVETKWLVLSAYSETYHQIRARRAGANGFLSKRALTSELMDAVNALLGGQDYPDDFGQILDRYGESTGSQDLHQLSEREMTVFRLISEGLSVEQIALALSRSRKTINAIRDRIRAKLNVRSSAELSRFATQWYLSQAEPNVPPMKFRRESRFKRENPE